MCSGEEAPLPLPVAAGTGPVPARTDPTSPDTPRAGGSGTGPTRHSSTDAGLRPRVPEHGPAGVRPPPGRGCAPPGAPAGSAEDAALVRRALGGDHRAWEGIVDRHLPTVNAIARTYRLSGPDREDAVQTVWLTLNQQLPRLRSPDRLRAWLRRVTHGVCSRQRRCAQRQRAVGPHDLAALAPAAAPDPEAEYLRGERHDALHRAIRALADPADRRAALSYLADPPDPGAPRTARPGERDGQANPRAAANQRRRVLRGLRRLLEEPT